MSVRSAQTPYALASAVPSLVGSELGAVAQACSAFIRAGYSSDIRAVLSANSSTHTFTMAEGGRGQIYLQGALELLDQEGEWAVRGGVLYFWPYSKGGEPVDPNDLTITAPVTQRVFSFVGRSHSELVSGITLSGLRIIGADMPATYEFMCKVSPATADTSLLAGRLTQNCCRPQGQGAGASPAGANCAADGGPDTPDETNTSPRAASQGMIYMENATRITVKDCMLRAGGISGIWFEEYNLHHVRPVSI